MHLLEVMVQVNCVAVESEAVARTSLLVAGVQVAMVVTKMAHCVVPNAEIHVLTLKRLSVSKWILTVYNLMYFIRYSVYAFCEVREMSPLFCCFIGLRF